MSMPKEVRYQDYLGSCMAVTPVKGSPGLWFSFADKKILLTKHALGHLSEQIKEQLAIVDPWPETNVQYR